jgi:hypothetical protein
MKFLKLELDKLQVGEIYSFNVFLYDNAKKMRCPVLYIGEELEESR